MNGMAGVLLLCALLLSNEVMCQESATDATATDTPVDPNTAPPSATDAVAAPGTAVAPDASSAPADPAVDQPAASVVPGDNPSVTDANTAVTDGGISGTTVVPSAGGNKDATTAEAEVVLKNVVPDVTCVDKESIQESNAVKVVVTTANCEDTKRIIEENPAPWCQEENCHLEIFQEGNRALVSSKEASLGYVAEVLRSDHLKDKLGVTETDVPTSPNSSVFVGILVTGLLAAAAITIGYFKCQRRSDTKGARLAEETYPVDQENQGNTLVSVAPLNPPQETQEKPSVNGESPEAAKTEPPPTNGHSTTKTADTELWNSHK